MTQPCTVARKNSSPNDRNTEFVSPNSGGDMDTARISSAFNTELDASDIILYGGGSNQFRYGKGRLAASLPSSSGSKSSTPTANRLYRLD